MLLQAGLQRKAIRILSLFYCLCCFSLSSPPVGDIQSLYFAALILQFFFSRVTETGTYQKPHHNETMLTMCVFCMQHEEKRVAQTSQRKQDFHCRCAKRRAERRTGGVKHSLCVSYVKSGECPINPDGDSRVNIYVHKPD